MTAPPTRTVHCRKYQQELEGLDSPPLPGPLGDEIFATVSKKAWQEWQTQQTMLINENRLSPINPEHRAYLETEMEKYFFGKGSEKPQGYVAPDS